MAKYQVTHSCGHTETARLFGLGAERRKRIEWMERNLCTACWKAEKERARAEENERVAAIAERLGFVNLRGTEKQNAWAKAIRQAVYETVVKDNIVVNAETAAKILNLEENAKWWIDNRNDTPLQIVRVICGNYPNECRKIEEDVLKTKEQK